MVEHYTWLKNFHFRVLCSTQRIMSLSSQESLLTLMMLNRKYSMYLRVDSKCENLCARGVKGEIEWANWQSHNR